MKRTLALAVALSVMLLASTASAVNWVTWYCPIPYPDPPPPTCDSLGKVHYTCDQLHYFSTLATVDSDGDIPGPPTGVQCPACGLPNPTDPDSGTCHNFAWGPHKYYPPFWYGYNYYP